MSAASRRICDKEIGKAYRRYNRLWFDDSLPHDCDVFFSPEPDCYGQVHEEDGSWTLQLNPLYAVDHRAWKMVLIHEMVHLYLRPYLRHGKPFQDKMIDLAIRGAFKGLW